MINYIIKQDGEDYSIIMKVEEEIPSPRGGLIKVMAEDFSHPAVMLCTPKYY